MKLFFKTIGKGSPLIILHGLFGSSDNWQTLGNKFAEYRSCIFPDGFEVFLVDQRNHGRSPHSDSWNYQVMSKDLNELIDDNKIKNPIIIGHSIGGKVAMKFALEHPEKIYRLVIVDIAPKNYPESHGDILKALKSVDLEKLDSRSDAEKRLSKYIKDFSTLQFLLKNLYWHSALRSTGVDEDIKEKKLAWRFNLKVIYENINMAREAIHGLAMPKPSFSVLFLRGEKSNYIMDSDINLIKELFPGAILKIIANAGHWIHADQPKTFFDEIIQFAEF